MGHEWIIDEAAASELLEQRQKLLTEGRFSASAALGTVAIITELRDNDGVVDTAQQQALLQERCNMVHFFRMNSRKIEDIVRATAGDIAHVIEDPAISDICVIAHGSLGSVYAEPDAGSSSYRPFTYKDVSDAANHLKLGSFYMRTCSGFGQSRLPWALGMAACPENILVAKHIALPNDHIARLPSELLTQLLPSSGQALTPNVVNDSIKNHASANNVRLLR